MIRYVNIFIDSFTLTREKSLGQMFRIEYCPTDFFFLNPIILRD